MAMAFDLQQLAMRQQASRQFLTAQRLHNALDD